MTTGSCRFTMLCTFETVTGEATTAMTRPWGSLTGTAETTDCPRDPSNVSVKDFPAAAREKGPTTRLPICRGSLWVMVSPSSV